MAGCSPQEIEAYLDGELDASRTVAAAAHLETCESCSSLYRNLMGLREEIRTDAPYYSAPPELEGRIRAALGSTEHSGNPWKWWAIAASVAFAALLLWTLQPRQPDVLAREVVSSHVRSLMGDHLMDVPSTDQHTVKPWFTGKLDFAPPVNALAGSGFTLLGGRLDYLNGRSVAALVYQRRQHMVNVFIWPADSDRAAEEQTFSGYHVLHWSKGGMTYWLVSDVAAGDLRELAELLKR